MDCKIFKFERFKEIFAEARKRRYIAVPHYFDGRYTKYIFHCEYMKFHCIYTTFDVEEYRELRLMMF